MHVGVNTLFLIPGEVGGSETYLVQTLLAMAADHANTRLTLFTNLENDAFLREIFGAFPQVAFLLLPFQARNRPHRILREQMHLPWAVRQSGVDVLWSPGYTAPICCHIPQVVTIHDMQYKSHPEDMTLSTRLATDILVQAAVRRCRFIIAISEFSKQEITFHTKANPNKIKVIYEAADPAFIPTLPVQVIRESLSHVLPSDIPYLLCVANTYPHKNVAALIRAFGCVRERITHRLLLVGKPRLGEPDVAQALADIPKERVQRLDGVDRQTLIALYQCADLFIFPSLYEGFGLPVLEAMAAGTPVLTTRMGSIPEVGGDCVWYFETSPATALDAAIQKLLDLPPDQRQARVDAAQKRARAFTWGDTATATVQCLRRIAASAPKK
jgi:glycosyltransferase involved in cell wall biosynthesis